MLELGTPELAQVVSRPGTRRTRSRAHSQSGQRNPACAMGGSRSPSQRGRGRGRNRDRSKSRGRRARDDWKRDRDHIVALQRQLADKKKEIKAVKQPEPGW